jgi:aryl carrier-like protein
MTPQEGVDAFARLLGVKAVSQLVVSTCDLESRLELWARPKDTVASECSTPGHIENGNEAAVHAQNDTTQDGIQARLSDIWGDLLGLDQVGVDDNFFDLGGDSLLALQVTSRLRESLLADLSVATVLESPTIAELTQRVIEQKQSISTSDRASELLQEISSISPEEKEKLLAKARQQQGIGK